jgi:hypothetical protein
LAFFRGCIISNGLLKDFTMKTKIIFNLGACLMLFCGARGLSQETLSFDTGTASEWSITGGGAQNATPFIVNYAYGTPSTYYNFISVTTAGDGTGNFLQGGSLADFTGFWLATYTFTLPSNATGVSLNYSDFYADDRAVLTLNGQVVAATGIISIQGAPGSMVFTDGGSPQSYSFSSLFSSGTVNSGFNIGGLNTIEAIVNNTGTGIYGPDRSISPGDDTFLGLSGTISYSQVPEPSCLAMFGIGILSLIGMLKRKQ